MIVLHSKERWRATANERRRYGGKTVTKFIAYHSEDSEDASKWIEVTGYGPTPGDRKTFAKKIAEERLVP